MPSTHVNNDVTSKGLNWKDNAVSSDSTATNLEMGVLAEGIATIGGISGKSH